MDMAFEHFRRSVRQLLSAPLAGFMEEFTTVQAVRKVRRLGHESANLCWIELKNKTVWQGQ